MFFMYLWVVGTEPNKLLESKLREQTVEKSLEIYIYSSNKNAAPTNSMFSFC